MTKHELGKTVAIIKKWIENKGFKVVTYLNQSNAYEYTLAYIFIQSKQDKFAIYVSYHLPSFYYPPRGLYTVITTAVPIATKQSVEDYLQQNAICQPLVYLDD